MSARVAIEPQLLDWACRRSGHGREAFADRFPHLEAWITGEVRPTFKQLEEFAKATHTPFGYFFLPEPPEERLPIPDFRTVSGKPSARPSPNLLDTVYAMQRRQAWLKENNVDEGREPLDFVGSAKLSEPPEAIGAEMRRMLGLGDGWAAEVASWEQALTELRRRIEDLGIMAVVNGVVGNDTHRRLDVDEFRGFALPDPFAPLIFVNGADAKSAQMFTLAHELAHLWLGAEGVSGFEGLFPRGSDPETWCDKAAAELLVPEEALRRRWPDVRRSENAFRDLARTFRVSPIVAARRALDLRLIGRESFFDFYDDYTQRERGRAQAAGGGDFYNNQNTRAGPLFARQVMYAAVEGRIGFQEAYDLTGLKDGTFQKYASRLGVSL